MSRTTDRPTWLAISRRPIRREAGVLVRSVLALNARAGSTTVARRAGASPMTSALPTDAATPVAQWWPAFRRLFQRSIDRNA